MRVAVACLLAMMLSGCFAHCEYTPSEAVWRDEGLYTAMGVDATAPDGLDVGIPDVALRYAQYRHASPDGVYYYRGGLHADIWDPDQMDGIRDDARAFLQNATALDADQIEARVDRLLAAPVEDAPAAYRYEDDQSYRIDAYRLDISADMNATLLLAALEYDGEGREDPTVPGWSLGFEVAKKHLALGDYSLVVDAHGRAQMQHAWPELHPDEAVQADVRRILIEAGLPAPQEIETSGYVC